MAFATATGFATGIISVYPTAIRTQEIQDVADYSNIDLEEYRNSVIWKGQPRIIACSTNDGSEIYRHKFDGDKLIGYYVDFPSAIIGDEDNIFKFNLSNASLDTLFQLKKFNLGKQRYLLKITEDEYLSITSNGSGGARGNYVAKFSLKKNEPVWIVSTAINGHIVDQPVLLAQGLDYLYFIHDEYLISVNIDKGELHWGQELKDIGWSISVHEGSLVYYNKKDKKVYYCK